MKIRMTWILSLLVALSMLLGACASPAAPTVAVQPTEAPVVTEAAPEPVATQAPEPTEAPAEVVAPAQPEELDSAYNDLLASMKSYNTIKMDAFSEQLLEPTPPFVLDVRQPEEVEKNGYIEGAVLIPLRELGDNLDKLPSFDTPIVSYCGSGWRCTIAMTTLSALGWENVTCLKDNSFTGWVDAGNPVVEGMPEEAPSLDAVQPDPALAMTMQEVTANIPDGWGVITADDLATAVAENPDLVVMDVRTVDEVNDQGYMDGSVNIPLQEFVDQRASWPADKDTPIVVYCGSGHRSTMAMTMLWSYGYTDVKSLKGGFAAWKDAGYGVVGGKPAEEPAAEGANLDTAFQNMLDTMVSYNTMSLDNLNLALGEDQPPFVLDVRQPEEAEKNGHIESAVMIPLRELAQNLDKLPSFETPIVSYCGSGWRCTIAMVALHALGWQDVTCLKGGSFSGWVEGGYPVVEGLPEEAPSLNAAEPDPAMVAEMDAMLQAIPEGYGGVAVSDLAAELMENSDLVLIDVRTDAERAEKGVIEYENQLAIPLEDFVAMQDQWPQDKDAPIVVYCGSGHRSTMAMTMLYSYGYTNVRSMKGGFSEWASAGYPVAEAVPAQ